MQLQEQWQSTVSTLVDDFETADVARVELIRDAVFKFEHYRSEFMKKSLNGVTPAVEVATSMTTSPQIAVMLGNNSSSSAEAAAQIPQNVDPQPPVKVASTEASPEAMSNVVSP
ncbi:hypothetical protein FBU59_005247, partial [Linderina macrospora]